MDAKIISFTVPAIPISQPRQRQRVVTIGGVARAVNYTSKSHPVTAFKATVRLAFLAAHHGAPLSGPVSVSMRFVFPRTKAMIWKTRPMPRELHAKAPDIDNIFKSVADALKGLAWVDDSQICRTSVEKWIASGDEQPHVWLEIEPCE